LNEYAHAHDRCSPAPTLIGELRAIKRSRRLARLGDRGSLPRSAAVVMDGAAIGRGPIVAGGALAPERYSFAPGPISAGVRAKVIAERDARANRSG
jgi:hypothetical protein